MPTYLVIERSSGHVVHTHVEPDHVGTAEQDVLEHVDPAHDRSGLQVVRVGDAPSAEGVLHRYDPESGTLEQSDDAPGFGGGTVRSAEAPPPSARVTYERAPEN